MTIRTAILLLALAVACHADPWQTWRGNPELSGSTSSAVELPLVKKWQYLSDQEFSGTPVGARGQVFAATTKGRIIALNTEGKELWTAQLTYVQEDGAVTNDTVATPLLLMGKILVACSGEGRVHGINTADGEDAWMYNAGEGIQGAPAVDGRNVIVLTQAKGVIHCIDSESGKKVWKTANEARADGNPAVVDGNVVYGNCNAMLLFIDANKGRERGRVEFGEGHEIAGTPAAVKGRIVVGTRAGFLMAVDPAKKKLIWEQDLGSGELFSAPAVLGDFTVVATDRGELVCFKGKQRKWDYQSTGSLGMPVITGKLVLVNAADQLKVFSLNDGAELGSVRCGEASLPPAIIDGTVVVAGDDSSIYGFGNKEKK